MDLSLLDASVMGVWGEPVQVELANGLTRNLKGVYSDAYAVDKLGNTDAEQHDPYFEFKRADYLGSGAAVGDRLRYQGQWYEIIADPKYVAGLWCSVMVRAY